MIALVILGAAVLFCVAVIVGQTIRIADLRADLAEAAAERTRCQETHVGELDAHTEATRPAAAALDRLVTAPWPINQSAGIHPPYPINRPHGGN